MFVTMGVMNWKPTLGSGAGPGLNPAIRATVGCVVVDGPPLLPLLHETTAAARSATPTNLRM
jgi:hypothetical protein